MCGIAGFITRAPMTEASVAAVDAAIAHRGPDDSGVWRGTCGSHHVTLLHRRLSILDLAHGQQPMLGAQGQHVIVYNGEIYNSPQLRQRLQDEGYAFETTCDTEVLLRLYEAKGEAMVDDLRGMFAFGIWNANSGELFIARDHFGQKPLFFAHDPETGDFAFASEIKGLLAAGCAGGFADCRIDTDTLWHHAGLRFCPGEGTLIAGITKLEPAHRAVIQPGAQAIATDHYWTQDWTQKTEMSFDEALDRLDTVLSDSVKAHLLADVPTGSFLSGGLDSSTISALATRHAGEGWPTFSIGVGDGDFSELPAAKLAAETIHSDHHELKINPDLFLMLPDVLWHLEEPADQPAVGMYLLSEFARKAVKVSLGGEGGDENFGGYTRYTQSPILKTYQRIPKFLRNALYAPIMRMLPESYSYYSTAMQARWLHEITQREGAERHTHILTFWRFPYAERLKLFGQPTINSLHDPDTNRFVAKWHNAGLADNEADRLMMTELSLRMANSDLRASDRVSMAHGLELRCPMIDREVNAFAASLPSTYKIQGKKLKIIMRELNRRMFPPEFTDRPKYGFSFPMARWFREDLAEFARSIILGGSLVQSGTFNADYIATVLDAHRAGTRDAGLQIWYLINLEIWHRVFMKNQPRDEVREWLREELERSRATYAKPQGSGAA